MKIACFILLLFLSSQSQGQIVTPIIPGKQTAVIIFSSERSAQFPRSRGDLWEKFCQEFGKALLSKPSQPGFLDGFECVGDHAPVVPLEKDAWRIALIERKRYMDIRVSFGKGREERLVQNLSFHPKSDALTTLQSPHTALILARILVENVPTGWVYEHDSRIDLTTPPQLPPLPQELFIYDLFYQEPGVFLPRIRSRLLRKDPSKAFQVANNYLPLRDGKRYWIQNAESNRSLKDEYNFALSKNLENLSLLAESDRLFLDRLDANYAALHYGKSVLKGSSVKTKTELNAFTLELRKGSWAGLRLKYEVVPKVDQVSEAGQEIFTMRRSSLGWAFDWEPPSSWQVYISRFEVQPTLEFLDLKTRSIIEHENGLESNLNFDENDMVQLAMTLGVEKEFQTCRSRLWVDFNTGITNQSVSIQSSRMGFDHYFHIARHSRNFGLDLLLSGTAEHLILNNSSSNVRSNQDLRVDELNFNLFFLGGGIALSW